MTDILRTIGSIARELDAIANIEFKDLSLTKGQYLYLARICENPGIIQGELAEMLRVDRTTAARALKKLEDMGMIRREADEVNLKIRRLYPNAMGQKVYPIIKHENDYSNQTALAGLSSAEIQKLGILLGKIEENINADWKTVRKGKRRNY